MVNERTGWRPIHWLAAHGELDLIKKIVAKGALCNLPDRVLGYYPVDIAGSLGYEPVVEYFIEQSLIKIERKVLHADAA